MGSRGKQGGRLLRFKGRHFCELAHEKVVVLQKVKPGLAPVHTDTSRFIVGYKSGPNTSTHPLQSRLPQCGDMLALPGDQEALGKWNQSPSSVAAVRNSLGEGVSRSHGGGEK